mgnify:CR=1 FL=1
MYNPPIFKNRDEAGRKLSAELERLELRDAVVLAIPAGGVTVGKVVAETLDAPLDLIVVRKIKIPWNPEAGFGAVAPDGNVILNPEITPTLGLTDEEIERLAQETLEEVKRREGLFRGDRPEPNLKDKTVVLVDDGLATGYKMLAAARSVRKKNPKKVLVAVPTASGGAVKLLEPEVDQLISLYIHPSGELFAVASSYKEWHDLTDEEVLACLK